MGKKADLRAKGCKKALDYYKIHHRPSYSNWLIKCQIGGEMVEPGDLTPAHKIERPHIKAGTEKGEGEHPSNIWAACWKHHREIDLRPLLKKELMRQRVSCQHGGTLKLTTDQKQQLGVN